MQTLNEDERTLKPPFWEFESSEEERVVDRCLRRRFAETHRRLTAALEAADPIDIVYPDNPGEYADVVREILVLLAPVNGDLAALGEDELERIVREGLARRFGEEPATAAVQRAVELLARRA